MTRSASDAGETRKGYRSVRVTYEEAERLLAVLTKELERTGEKEIADLADTVAASMDHVRALFHRKMERRASRKRDRSA